ncbi:MAG TPA: MBL fold metallo-hydrolase [Solirubrobacterales bacterium]|nr:MBL fold metallo-hydrolase [Solirubrobacterales bacterium]
MHGNGEVSTGPADGSGDPWARSEEQGIFRLLLPTPFAVGPVNTFLIEDDPLTLVDCGTDEPESLAALEAGLAARGRRLADIELLLLTHQHVDHMGGAHVVARRAGAEVACLDRLAPFAESFEEACAAEDAVVFATLRENGAAAELVEAATEAARRRRSLGRAVAIDRSLAAGEQVVLRDRRLEVHHRPGHSPTDTVFLDRGRRTLLGGDHLLPEISSNALIGRGPIGEGGRYRPLVTYRAALRKTLAMELELVLPGHGGPVRDHRALIEGRLAHQERRATELLGLLGGEPRSAREIAQARWGEVAEKQVFLTISEVLGHMDLLLDEGRVRREQGAGGIVRFRAA